MNEYEANYMSSNGFEAHESFKGNSEDLKKWIENKIGSDYEILNELNILISKDGNGRIHIEKLQNFLKSS
jgi:hypothetical protein